MLVVIGIIGALAGMLLTAVTLARRAAKRTQAKDMTLQIATAWGCYLNDYREFPTTNGVCVNITEMDKNACLILVGSNFCSRGVLVYLECSTNDLKNGMLDPWGVTYKLSLDNGQGLDSKSYDGRVRVPGNQIVCKDVAVWSLGPDKAEGTSDDVTSWGK